MKVKTPVTQRKMRNKNLNSFQQTAILMILSNKMMKTQAQSQKKKKTSSKKTK